MIGSTHPPKCILIDGLSVKWILTKYQVSILLMDFWYTEVPGVNQAVNRMCTRFKLRMLKLSYS